MKLFLSYARENMDRVAYLSTILKSGGHFTWYDEELLPGQDWKAQLQREIDACEGFIYAMTRLSLISEWCIWELATAIHSNKAIIPVLLEPDLEIPPSLQKLQFCDYSKGASAEQTAKLMFALTGLQKVPISQAPSVPADPQGPPARVSAELWRELTEFLSSGQKPSFGLNRGEVILDRFVVTYWKSTFTYSKGVLIITNERLFFESYKLPLIRMDPFYISISTISELVPIKMLGVTSGVKLSCRSGDRFTFSTYGGGKLVRLIREQLDKLAG